MKTWHFVVMSYGIEGREEDQTYVCVLAPIQLSTQEGLVILAFHPFTTAAAACGVESGVPSLV